MLPENFIQSVLHVKGFDRQSFERVHEVAKPITSVRINTAKKTNLFSDRSFISCRCLLCARSK